MSRFMVEFTVFLTFLFCLGVKGQKLNECLEEMEYQNGITSLVRLAAEKEFEIACSNMRRVVTCVDNAAKEQFGMDVKELAILLNGTELGKAFQILANIEDLIEEWCTKGTQLNKDYLKDVKCYRNLNRYALMKCEKDAAAASVIFQHMDKDDSFDHSIDEPCVITSYKVGCIGADILEECGKRAFTTFKEFVRKTGFFKVGMCPPDIIQALNTTIVDSLETSESRRSVYHMILSLKKRRK